MKRSSAVLLLVILLAGTGWPSAQPVEIAAGLFSRSIAGEKQPAGWQPLSFKGIDRYTDYSLVADAGTVVIKAVSEQSASGLMRPLSLSPKDYPFIQWRWKVENILRKGDVTRKSGDDYPARIYITFAFDPGQASYLERLRYRAARLIYGPDVPYRAITYIWGSNSTAGTMIENPYTDRVMMFVVEGGDAKAQQWITERRNVYADYKTAFGEEPAMISGVAIMTDTDNTQESAVAWYGDIVFRTDPDSK
ncbi:MAG: DUF3047 domain-containing protein [Gammaproteobacteria bacterium]